MPIRFLPDQPARRSAPQLVSIVKMVPALLREIGTARAERQRKEAQIAKARQRQLERYHNGFYSLGVSIRNTTGNYGKPGPRRYLW